MACGTAVAQQDWSDASGPDRTALDRVPFFFGAMPAPIFFDAMPAPMDRIERTHCLAVY